MRLVFAALLLMSLIAFFAVSFSCGDQNDEEDDDIVADDDTGDDEPHGEFELTWMPIPGGTFTMGCSPNDSDCEEDEYPSHEVTLEPFEMTETEVTQWEYYEVVGRNPSKFRDCPDCPVEEISYDEAYNFCVSIEARLPTEAEWEYAARGGATTRYSCGDDPSCLPTAGWYYGNSGLTTHLVKGKYPNGFGLYDMQGNVWEWVADKYGANYYSVSPAESPEGPEEGDGRVLRGGAYNSDADSLRLSDRSKGPVSNWGTILGIRCVRD